MSLVCFISLRDGPRFVHPPIRSRVLDRLCVGPRRRGGPRGGAGVRADTRAHFSWAYPSGWGPRIVATPCSAPGGTARPFPRVAAPFFYPTSKPLPSSVSPSCQWGWGDWRGYPATSRRGGSASPLSWPGRLSPGPPERGREWGRWVWGPSSAREGSRASISPWSGQVCSTRNVSAAFLGLQG